MNIIKGLALLPADINKDRLEAGALLHRRHSNITFKIKEVTDSTITIQIAQGTNAGGNYFPQRRLIEIVQESFPDLFERYRVLVHAIPFTPSPVECVTPKWIDKKMAATGVRLKDIVADTGLDTTQASALISGSRTLSQPVKAMFYYYFLNKQKKTA